MRDLRAHSVDILTLGQYLRPSPKHLPIVRYVPPGGVRRAAARGPGDGVCARGIRPAGAQFLSRRAGRGAPPLIDAALKDNLRVVLVSTRNPLNIGASARAMANFGFSRLRVVNPYDVAFREARSAVGAAPLLRSAEEFPTRGRRRGRLPPGGGDHFAWAIASCNIPSAAWNTARGSSCARWRRPPWRCCSVRRSSASRTKNSATATG